MTAGPSSRRSVRPPLRSSSVPGSSGWRWPPRCGTRDLEVTVVAPEPIPLAHIIGDELRLVRPRPPRGARRHLPPRPRRPRGAPERGRARRRHRPARRPGGDRGRGTTPHRPRRGGRARGRQGDRRRRPAAHQRPVHLGGGRLGPLSRTPTPAASGSSTGCSPSGRARPPPPTSSGTTSPSPPRPFFWSQHYDIPINVTGPRRRLGRGGGATATRPAHDVIVGLPQGGQGAWRWPRSTATGTTCAPSCALAAGDQEALDGLLSG